jgi:hypothetical protein
MTRMMAMLKVTMFVLCLEVRAEHSASLTAGVSQLRRWECQSWTRR